LLVVDDVPISTDDAIEARLDALEMDRPIEVIRLAEAETAPADTDGFDLVVVSSSADSGGIGGTLKDIVVPMLVLEPGIFNLMGLGGVRGSGMDAEITIIDESHPIAHGKTGTLTLCGGPVDMVAQQLLPGGIMIAQASLNVNAGVIVAYEKGVDVGGPLPAGRGSFGSLKLAACQTAEAWRFFDEAVLWLTQL
jgi:hypothetical protein